jgi:iron-sulfur cluster repair protein YtfE (RIC family)
MTSRTSQADSIERRFVANEHQELMRGLGRLIDVAEECDRVAVPDLIHALNGVLHWLEQSLEPHAVWEEQWLHPRLDEFGGSHLPTSILSFQHHQIRERIEALRRRRDALVAEAHPARPRDVPGRLYGLEAVIRAHVECEDRMIANILDAPTGALV